MAWGLMRRFDLAATTAAPSTCDGDDTASSFDANVAALLGDRLVVGGLNAWTHGGLTGGGLNSKALAVEGAVEM